MATIRGTENADTLTGTPDGDFLYGGSGNDRLLSLDGSDYLYGEGGNDTLEGGFGRDLLYGGFGNDALRGGEGDDTLQGDDGSDVLQGGGGNDTLYGEEGNDILSGDAGNDYLSGANGTDWLLGGAGDDSLYGNAGDDWLNPGSGDNQFVNGGDGIDTLVRDVPVRATTFFTAGPGSSAQAARLNSDDATMTFSQIEAFEFADGRYTVDQRDLSAQAYRLYQAALGRVPDAYGLSYQVEVLADGALGRPGGAGIQQVALGFLGSAEFAARYGALDDAGFVAQLYRNVLGREADGAGQGYWVGQVAAIGRAGVLLGFAESAENLDLTRAAVVDGLWVADWEAGQVLRMYDTVLGRRPDGAGLAYWDNQLENGAASLRGMADALAGSAEFRQAYGALGDRAFVEALYANSLDRAADAAGTDYWTAQLGTLGRAGVVLAFSESAEHVALTARFQTPTGFDLLG